MIEEERVHLANGMSVTKMTLETFGFIVAHMAARGLTPDVRRVPEALELLESTLDAFGPNGWAHSGQWFSDPEHTASMLDSFIADRGITSLTSTEVEYVLAMYDETVSKLPDTYEIPISDYRKRIREGQSAQRSSADV